MEKQIVVEKKNNSRVFKGIAAAGLALALGAGGALAWFTASDSVENVISVSNLGNGEEGNDVVIEEPNFDPEQAVDLLPTEEISKDPQVANKSDAEVWAWAELKVPVAEVSVLDADGAPGAAAEQELYTYTIDTTNWTKVGETVVADGYATTTYALNDKLPAGGTSAPLFETVALKNLADAQGVSGPQNITVTAKTIQTLGIDSIDDAMAAYAAQHA